MKEGNCNCGNLLPIRIIPIHGTAINKEFNVKAAMEGTKAELDTQNVVRRFQTIKNGKYSGTADSFFDCNLRLQFLAER